MSGRSSLPAADATAWTADAYLALARDLGFWDAPLADALHALVRAAAAATGTTRCGLWQVTGEAAAPRLRLLAQHEVAGTGPAVGIEIDGRRYPRYVAALEAGRLVDADDARQDPRTRELTSDYLDTHGVGALLDATLRRSGRLWGVLCVEHVGPSRRWSDDERRFVVSMAELALQRLAHEDLKRSETAYRTLFATATNGMLLLDGDRFVDLNPAAERLFGCARDALLGSSLADWAPPLQPDGRPSREAATLHLEATLRDGACAFDWRCRRADGSTLEAEVALTAIRIAGNARVLAEVRDVSERVHALAQVAAYSEELAERNRRLQALHRLGTRLLGCRDGAAICSETVQAAAAVTTCDFIAVLLLDADGRQVRVAAAQGLPAAVSEGGLSVFGTHGLIGDVLRRGDIRHVREVGDEALALPEVRSALVGAGLRSLTIVPLGTREAPVGALCLGWRTTRAEPDAATLEIFDTMGHTVTLALANTRHLAGLEHQAHHDSLTGLPNRQMLHREYAGRVPASAPAALYLLDLDRFKEVNDTLGHHVGDRLLAQLAERVHADAGTGALACRLGGDEFAVLVPGVGEGEAALARGERLRRALRQPYAVDGLLLQVDASIGVAIAPRDGTDSHELLRKADVAMYEAKRRGAAVVPYHPRLDRHSPERLALVGELDRALRDDELTLHFQPKYELGTGGVVGYEGLLRWQHPQRGLLLPGDFLPLEEVGSAIHALTDRVLDLAAATQVRWRALGHDHRIAVNLSPRNLADESIVARVAAALGRHGADPARLELELTETALLHDAERAARLLERLGALGVVITIDDFGTGYSSLSHLRRLPIGALMIDRSFVGAMREAGADAAIVRAAVMLAHSLGLRVVAEGVEDAATADALAALGCDEGQGFLYSAAIPPAALEAAWRRPA